MNLFIPDLRKERRLFFYSVFSSLMLHVLFVFFFQNHSLWFSSKLPSIPSVSANKWSNLVTKINRQEILEEAFAPKKQAKAKKEIGASLAPQKEVLFLMPSELSFSLPNLPSSSAPLMPVFPSEELLALGHKISSSISPSFPPIKHSFFLDLPKELISPISKPLFALESIKPREEKTISEAFANETSPQVAAKTSETIFFEQQAIDAPSIEKQIKKANIVVGSLKLPVLPSLSDLETINLSDYFDSDLVFLPREDQSGYLFALTLIPRKDLQIPKIRQHVTFLIDRSNSIQRERLLASKNAVRKAIEELDENDTFNVFVFDNKVEKLFPSLTAITPEAIKKAHAFFEKIQLGSFFATADLYKPLLHSIPAKVGDGELYTTILLTDGENLSKKNVQRSLLHDWTYQNQGRTALYTVAMGGDHHLGSLDAISVLNKGRLLYSTTKRGIKRKLLKLMKTIQTPVAKNISFTAISHAPTEKNQTHIEIYPKPQSASPLYLDQPYVILGTTPTLDDFIFFLQGRLADRWLNVKKTISFTSAKKGDHNLKAEWALQKAYSEYEEYVLDDNPKHLAEAQLLLEPFNLQTAFE